MLNSTFCKLAKDMEVCYNYAQYLIKGHTMSNILSLQSHVAYGYVGNRAAVFPLQRLGNEVVVINTVQFSNHTGYGDWTGDIMSIEHIDNIFYGLEKRGVFNKLDAVLTGYLGDSQLGDVLIKWLGIIKLNNPKLIYCCDPVIGDVGRGVFVKPGVPEFFLNQTLNCANILTPNQFELEYLTGINIQILSDALEACAILHNKGVEIILLTSLECNDYISAGTIGMLVSTSTIKYLIKTPKIQMPIAPNGSGDMTAALFLAKYLETKDLQLTLEFVAAAVYSIFQETLTLQQRELAIIAAQEQFINPNYTFKAIKL